MASKEEIGNRYSNVYGGAFSSRVIVRYFRYVVDRKKQPRWRGVRIVKLPNDLILYAESIFANCPDYIIETGSRHGGSALFFADMLSLVGGRRVFSVDTDSRDKKGHPLVEYINASSTDMDVVSYLRSRVGNESSVMVTLDSDHSFKHVAKELDLYSTLVTPGQYMVVEDCWADHLYHKAPYRAVSEFLSQHSSFERHNLEDRFIFSFTRDGWLWKKP